MYEVKIQHAMYEVQHTMYEVQHKIQHTMYEVKIRLIIIKYNKHCIYTIYNIHCIYKLYEVKIYHLTELVFVLLHARCRLIPLD